MRLIAVPVVVSVCGESHSVGTAASISSTRASKSQRLRSQED